MPFHAPRKTESPFTDGSFDALAACLLEGLRVGEGGVVSSKSRRWKPMTRKRTVRSFFCQKVFRSEGPRLTPEQLGLDHLGLQHGGIASTTCWLISIFCGIPPGVFYVL